MTAQNNSAVIEKMNEIKLDESFIFGEGFHASKDVAHDCAISGILSYAIELRFEKGNKEKLSTSDISPIVKQLTHFDGCQYNVFIYVDKERILTMSGHTHKISSNAHPKNESKDAAIPDKPMTQSTLVETPLERRFTPLHNDLLNTLCNQDNWTEIKGILSTYKSQGKIRETGFCTNVSDIPKDSYRILIDEQYGILAILAPENMTDLINIKTNQLDKESNYSNCAVIVWFK